VGLLTVGKINFLTVIRALQNTCFKFQEHKEQFKNATTALAVDRLSALHVIGAVSRKLPSGVLSMSLIS